MAGSSTSSSTRLFNLELHQRRADLTTLAHFGRSVQHDLKAALSGKNLPLEGLHKIRVTYGIEVQSIDIEPYARRDVQGVQLVEAPGLDYRYKFANRGGLNALRAGLAEGVEPIIVQDGLITDGIYANICVYDGGRWVTPAWPLLAGVARQIALTSGQLNAGKITAADVHAGKFQKIRLINCMNLFAEAKEIILP